MTTPGAAPGDPERTGPVAAEMISGAWTSETAEAGTGPLPVTGAEPSVADPGSTTIRYSVREGAPGQNPPRDGSAPAAYGTSPGSGSHRNPARSGQPNPAQRPVGGPQAHSGSAQAHPAHQGMPGSPAPGDPHAGYPASAPQRRASRDANVVAFVLNQFPIGHMPVATPHPDRQVPVPEPAAEHPSEALISEIEVQARFRSGSRRAPVRDTGAAVPEQLLEGYEPHGDLGELEWERTYRTVPGLVWPEGEPDRAPEVLDPGTVVDRVGTGFGRVLTPDATPFDQRGAPPDYVRRDYHRYRVEHPLPVWRDSTEAWFGQPGGAARYRTTRPVVELVALGHLVELTEAVADRNRSASSETGAELEESAHTIRIGFPESPDAETLRLGSTRTAEEDDR